MSRTVSQHALRPPGQQETPCPTERTGSFSDQVAPLSGNAREDFRKSMIRKAWGSSCRVTQASLPK